LPESETIQRGVFKTLNMKLTEIFTEVWGQVLNLVQGAEEWNVANITATSEKTLRNC